MIVEHAFAVVAKPHPAEAAVWERRTELARTQRPDGGIDQHRALRMARLAVRASGNLGRDREEDGYGAKRSSKRAVRPVIGSLTSPVVTTWGREVSGR